MFINKQKGLENKDMSEGRDLQYYLDLTRDFKSSFPPFNVKEVGGFFVIDESVSNPVGAKARFGELLVRSMKEREMVYVQPRRGYAGISLSYLGKKFGKDLTLIMPASKEASEHQRLCIDLGARALFTRVAAMPNANATAKKWAEATGSAFIPLGLQHELITACGVRCVWEFFKNREKPKRMWCVISTGVLSRILQIALPDTEIINVAVARNIQQGELGRAKFWAYHKPFEAKSDLIPTAFNCEESYDAKGWDYMNRYGEQGDWFFSVAGNAPKATIQPKEVDSYRDWNDARDIKNNIPNVDKR